MNTKQGSGEPHITMNLRQCGELDHQHPSNGIAKLFLVIIGIVVLGVAIAVSVDNFEAYDKAIQAENDQNAEKLYDQETAPTVVKE